MTAFTATFSAAVRCFGGAATDKWADYNWNAFKWAQGTNTLPFRFTHQLVSPSISAAQTADFRLTKLVGPESQVSTAAVGVRVVVMLNGQTIGGSVQMAHEYLQDPEGYYHVFPEQVTDLTLRSTPTWTAVTSSTVTWTTSVAGSTTWS